MSFVPRISVAFVAVALFAGPVVRSQAAGQAEDPFERLKGYDFQSRQPVEAIRLMIDKSAADKAATGQIEQKLDGVLADPGSSFAGKQEAARFLWIIGTGRSVQVLSRLLTDDKLSDVARYALERNTDPSAGAALASALPMAQGKILVGLINSIGDRGDVEADAALERYVHDSDPLIAEAAISAVGKIGSAESIDILKALSESSNTVGVALRRTAEKLAVSGRKAAAAHVYGLLWSASRPSNIRGEAVRGLANIAAPNAANVALSALKSGDPYLQIVAAQVIGSMKDPKTISRAIGEWNRLAAPTQVALLTVISEQRDPSVGKLAIDAAASKDPSVRAAGIRAAGRSGGVAAIGVLVNLMLHGDGADRTAAHDALASMRGDASEKAILDQARHGAPDVRATMIGVLVDRPSPSAIAALSEIANSADARSAEAAIRAIGKVGGPKEYADMIRLVTVARSDETRDAARDSLVLIGQRMRDKNRASEPVFAAYSLASGPAKAALLMALAELGSDRALTELKSSSTAADADLKQAAIRGLAETWPDSRALDALITVAKTEQNRGLRVQALRGYLRLVGQDEGLSPAERVAKISDGLKAAERPEEKRQALSVLREARTPAAVEVAAQYLSDSDLFGDAASTILYLAGPQRKNNRNLPAIKGEATSAALEKIIETTKDDNQRAQAQRLK